MPMSAKGKEILAKFKSRYGKKGEGYFYGKANKEGKGSTFYALAHGGK